MCNVIRIVDTLTHANLRKVETISEFIENFGFLPNKHDYYNSMPLNSCLCCADIEKTFTQNDIKFEKDCLDYIITQIEVLNACPYSDKRGVN